MDEPTKEEAEGDSVLCVVMPEGLREYTVIIEAFKIPTKEHKFSAASDESALQKAEMIVSKHERDNDDHVFRMHVQDASGFYLA